MWVQQQQPQRDDGWLVGGLAGWVMKRKMRICNSSNKKKQSWVWSYLHSLILLHAWGWTWASCFHCLGWKNCQQNQSLLEQIVYTARDIRTANRISHNAEAKLFTLREIRSANRIISQCFLAEGVKPRKRCNILIKEYHCRSCSANTKNTPFPQNKQPCHIP